MYLARFLLCIIWSLSWPTFLGNAESPGLETYGRTPKTAIRWTFKIALELPWSPSIAIPLGEPAAPIAQLWEQLLFGLFHHKWLKWHVDISCDEIAFPTTQLTIDPSPHFPGGRRNPFGNCNHLWILEECLVRWLFCLAPRSLVLAYKHLTVEGWGDQFWSVPCASTIWKVPCLNIVVPMLVLLSIPFEEMNHACLEAKIMRKSQTNFTQETIWHRYKLFALWFWQENHAFVLARKLHTLNLTKEAGPKAYLCLFSTSEYAECIRLITLVQNKPYLNKVNLVVLMCPKKVEFSPSVYVLCVLHCLRLAIALLFQGYATRMKPCKSTGANLGSFGCRNFGFILSLCRSMPTRSKFHDGRLRQLRDNTWNEINNFENTCSTEFEVSNQN